MVSFFLCQEFLQYFHYLIQKVLMNSTSEERMNRSGKTLGITENKRGTELKTSVLAFSPAPRLLLARSTQYWSTLQPRATAHGHAWQQAQPSKGNQSRMNLNWCNKTSQCFSTILFKLTQYEKRRSQRAKYYKDQQCFTMSNCDETLFSTFLGKGQSHTWRLQSGCKHTATSWRSYPHKSPGPGFFWQFSCAYWAGNYCLYLLYICFLQQNAESIWRWPKDKRIVHKYVF